MTINIKTGMLRTDESGQITATEAVQPTASANLDALKRSLASLKFVPQLSEAMSFDDNEIELSRAKSVLDQMASQAEQLMTRDAFIALIEDVIRETGTDIKPEIKQTLISHIQNMQNWNFDVLSMPAPESDTSEKDILSFLTTLSEKKPLQNEEVKPAITQVSSSDLSIVNDASGASAEDVLMEVKKLQSHKNIGGESDIIATQLGVLEGSIENNPGLATIPEIKSVGRKMLDSVAASAKSDVAGEAKPDLDKVSPGEPKDTNSQHRMPGQQIGSHAGQNGTNINLGIGEAIAAVGRGAGYVADKTKDTAGSIFNTIGVGAVAKERKQKAALNGLRRASHDLATAMSKCRAVDDKIEEEFIKNGGSLSLDSDGKWTPETVTAMRQMDSLKPLFRKSDVAKGELNKKAVDFGRQADVVEIQPDIATPEDVAAVSDQVGNLKNELTQGLKSDNDPTENNTIESQAEKKKWIDSLLEMVRKLIELIRAFFRGKQNASQAQSERVEPVFEFEPATPQP